MSRVDDWLQEAKEDLETAEILLRNGQYHHACFHSQQAAEKAVKALLLSFNKTRAGHSVLSLLQSVPSELSIPNEVWDCARLLDQYYIPPRYPNVFNRGTPSMYYTKSQAGQALECARKVTEFVEKGVKRAF